MSDYTEPFPRRADWELAGSQPLSDRSIQAPLFYARVSTRFPNSANGKDLSFNCFADDGHIYYCKDDSGPRPIRATEWICTQLARHLGIPAADCAVLEDENGDTFFGSKKPDRVIASRFELDDHLRRSAMDETGRPTSWMGQFLARLWAYDYFICNPDRGLQNLILDRDGSIGIVKAIDFASAQLLPFSVGKLPIESDPTVLVGRDLRQRFGSHQSAAFEMLDRIGAVPKSVIAGIIGQMPDDWLSEDQAGGLIEVWSNGKCQERVKELKALIENDW
ncbi:MAG: HipA family kinase [Sphingomonadaceae bacterium]